MAILFIFLGEHLITVTAKQPDNSMAKPALIVGYIVIIFFGIAAIYGVRTLFKKRNTAK